MAIRKEILPKESLTPEIDQHIGVRLRARRNLLGMSQEKLGEMVGLTFQQIQKYERGINRIGSGRLLEFASILSIPITYFYDGLSANVLTKLYGNDNVFEKTKLENVYQGEEGLDKDVQELVRAFTSIKDIDARKSCLDIVKTIAKQAK